LFPLLPVDGSELGELVADLEGRGLLQQARRTAPGLERRS
jgi:hypothetical protein